MAMCSTCHGGYDDLYEQWKCSQRGKVVCMRCYSECLWSGWNLICLPCSGIAVEPAEQCLQRPMPANADTGPCEADPERLQTEPCFQDCFVVPANSIQPGSAVPPDPNTSYLLETANSSSESGSDEARSGSNSSSTAISSSSLEWRPSHLPPPATLEWRPSQPGWFCYDLEWDKLYEELRLLEIERGFDDEAWLDDEHYNPFARPSMREPAYEIPPGTTNVSLPHPYLPDDDDLRETDPNRPNSRICPEREREKCRAEPHSSLPP